jgi:hypothetical protein
MPKRENPANGFATLNRRGACSFLPCHRRCCEPRITRIKRIIYNVTDERAIFPFVTILLLFRIGVTKRRGPRITRLRATLRRGRPRIDANFSQSLWHSAICLWRNSCDPRADLIENPKSDARTHRTPKSTSCKIHQKQCSLPRVLRRISGWNALSSTRWLRTRRSHLIFAPSATDQPSSRRGGPIHHNNRYAFLRYAMRPCSRASLTAARILSMAHPTGVSDPGYRHSAITSRTGPR